LIEFGKARFISFLIEMYLWVPVLDDEGGSVGLLLADIPRPEQELPVEVGLLNGVHVGDEYHSSGTGANANEGIVLHELAADGTGSDHEEAHVADAGLVVVAVDGDGGVVPSVLLFDSIDI
jgi:hypothetical protein